MEALKKYHPFKTVKLNEIDHSEILKIHLFTLKCLGIWKYDGNWWDHFLYNSFSFSVRYILYGFIMLSQLCYILFSVKTIDDFAKCYVSLICYQTYLKIVIFRSRQEDFLEVNRALQVPSFRPKTEAQGNNLLGGIRAAFLNIQVCYVLTVCAISIFPLTMSYEGRILPTEGVFFFDVKSSPNYQIVSVVQVLALYFFAGSACSIDTLFGTYLYSIVLQCEMLKDELVNIDKYSKKRNKFHKKTIEEALIQCVNYHSDILK